MRHSEVKDALQTGHNTWKEHHIPGDISIYSVLKTWDDPELIRIGMYLANNFSSAKDPEDWIWEKMIYLHYYAVHYFQCSEEADTFVRDMQMSDFEKLTRIVRLLILQSNIQQRTHSILDTNRA